MLQHAKNQEFIYLKFQLRINNAFQAVYVYALLAKLKITIVGTFDKLRDRDDR